MKRIVNIVKIGGIISIFGTAILVIFAILLVAYPVEKKCFAKTSDCYYVSKAPSPFSTFISPYFLVISISVITVGIGVFRFGSWFLRRTT